MGTAKQNEANRLNAQKSTGPRTVEGRKKVSNNALMHGLTANEVILDDEESRDYFDQRVAEYQSFYAPVSPDASHLIHRIVTHEIQARRATRATKGAITLLMERCVDHLWGCEPAPENPDIRYQLDTRFLGIAFMRDLHTDDTLSKFTRYEVAHDNLWLRMVKLLHQVKQPGLAEANPVDYETNPISNNPQQTQSPATTGQPPSDPPDTPVKTPGVNPVVAVPGPPTEPDPNHQTPASTDCQGGVSVQAPTPDNLATPVVAEPDPIHPTPTSTDCQGGVPARNNIYPPRQPYRRPSSTGANLTMKPCDICNRTESSGAHQSLASNSKLDDLTQNLNTDELALWRCRLHHVQDPAESYDIDAASVDRARLFDFPNQLPRVSIIEEKPDGGQ